MSPSLTAIANYPRRFLSERGTPGSARLAASSSYGIDAMRQFIIVQK
jgi:hypothetical protein